MQGENLSNEGQTVSLDEQIDGILNCESDNPVTDNNNDELTVEDKTIEESDDKIQCPEEFLNQDGTVNIDDLLKSYNELQPLATQKAEWEKEKTELQQQAEYGKELQAQIQANVQSLGYKNSDEYTLIHEIANIQANEYMKYLHTVGEPDKVRGLLALYAQSPNPELLERIEDEFNVDVVKNVSILAERSKNQLLHQQQEQRYETIRQEAEAFVQNSINDFPDWFKIPEFTNFFAEALRVKGDAFQTSEFVKHIENLKEYFRKEFIAEQNSNKENQNEIDVIKGLSPKTIQKPSVSKNIEDYSPEELDKAISEFI